MHRHLPLRRIRDDLLQFLPAVSQCPQHARLRHQGGIKDITHQGLEDTLVQHALSGAAVPQLLVVGVEAGPVATELLEAVLVDVVDAALISLRSPIQRYTTIPPAAPPYHHPLPSLSNSQKRSTHTLAAHLVTLRPSFRQSISAVPLLSVLHCIKSSLYFPHLAPIKKLALSSGAELAPTSCTAGIESGSGVVSMSVDWENLRIAVSGRVPGGRGCAIAASIGRWGGADEAAVGGGQTWPGVRTW